MTAWWPRSPQSQIASRTDRDQIVSSIGQLRTPCDQAWLMARVLSLLSQYFAADIPESVKRIEAEDWRAALGVWPAWAIEKACRWWKSDENPDHRRKPLEGDIVERVKFEMGIVSFGAMKVREYDAGYAKRTAAPEEVKPTPEEMEQRRAFAQDVMRKAGYAKDAKPKGPVRESVDPGEVEEMRAHLASRGLA